MTHQINRVIAGQQSKADALGMVRREYFSNGINANGIEISTRVDGGTGDESMQVAAPWSEFVPIFDRMLRQATEDAIEALNHGRSVDNIPDRITIADSIEVAGRGAGAVAAARPRRH